MKEDYLNIGFIVLSALVAFFFPFDLLLFAYAFLGPAHYLTQIPWLHKRSYFLDHPLEAWPLFLMTLLMVIFPNDYQDLIAITLLTALVLVFAKKIWTRLILILLLSGLVLLYQRLNGPNLFLFFLPTLVHVFIFTAIFIVQGAVKRKSGVGYVSVGLLFGAAASFFVLSPYSSNDFPVGFSDSHMQFFRQDVDEVVRLLGLDSSWRYLKASVQFIAFAYTYHYLNWFSKTETIGWNKLPRKFFFPICGFYLFFVGLYLYDFSIGLKALLYLSLLHVILELPLNATTSRSLVNTLFGRLRFRKS